MGDFGHRLIRRVASVFKSETYMQPLQPEVLSSKELTAPTTAEMMTNCKLPTCARADARDPENNNICDGTRISGMEQCSMRGQKYQQIAEVDVRRRCQRVFQ